MDCILIWSVHVTLSEAAWGFEGRDGKRRVCQGESGYRALPNYARAWVKRFMVVHAVGAGMQWWLWGLMFLHMEASEEPPCWMISCWPMTAQARQTSLCATRAHRPGASQPVSCHQVALTECP